jgi:hypothetical protein
VQKARQGEGRQSNSSKARSTQEEKMLASFQHYQTNELVVDPGEMFVPNDGTSYETPRVAFPFSTPTHLHSSSFPLPSTPRPLDCAPPSFPPTPRLSGLSTMPIAFLEDLLAREHSLYVQVRSLVFNFWKKKKEFSLMFILHMH